MEVELVIFGNGEKVYTRVQGVDWHRIIGSRTGRLPLNESVLNIITTLTKAAGALDGIEALRQQTERPRNTERAREARELFDALITAANDLAGQLNIRNAQGEYPEPDGLRRIGKKLGDEVTDKLEAVLESDEPGVDGISCTELRSILEKRVQQTVKEINRATDTTL